MRLFAVIWVFFAFGSCVWGRVALDQLDQQRPEDGIYDPGDWIFGQSRKSLIRELVSIRESSGIDVLVVVIESIGANDPQELAEELANRWGYYGGRALVLSIPENDQSPWIAVSGLIRSDVPAPTMDAIIVKARQRAQAGSTVPGEVAQAVGSLGEDLRFVAGRAARGVQQPAGRPAPPSTRQLLFYVFMTFKKVLLTIGAFCLGAFLVIFGSIRIWKRLRRSLKPKSFPEISWKPRFGAPYAGIVYTYSLKKKLHRPHDS